MNPAQMEVYYFLVNRAPMLEQMEEHRRNVNYSIYWPVDFILDDLNNIQELCR